MSTMADPNATKDETAPSVSGLRANVLVVEDNSVNRRVVSRMLEQLNCQVDVVENGAKAVVAARDANYDLVLMDCIMPVMDGWKAARAIRKIPGPSQRARIVAMTACGLHEDRRRCMDAGMDDYMLKPIDLAAVRDQVGMLEKVIDRES